MQAKIVEHWPRNHARWAELEAFCDAAGQRRYLDLLFDWHTGSDTFVALAGDQIVGLLRSCYQPIGPDEDCEPVVVDGKVLSEAKVIGFYVDEAWRRVGFGRNLQQLAMQHARERGCYQFRSRSSADKTANHQLKLDMGFCIVPTIRSGNRVGAFFVRRL